MSRGLIKAKKYDWKDSNLALFGSDTDKKVKKSSAQTEPAWKGAGAAPGKKIWRIEKFKVKETSPEDNGVFFSGDSYIILNTYKDADGDNLLHDVHFWIGKNSSQDEYGTAAYKTVELDTYLDDVPVQHRECQGHESELFKSYFPKGITTLEGGIDSGFRTVPTEHYEPRLLHFSQDKSGNVAVREIPRVASKVSEDDVYILDLGKQILLYQGSKCSVREKTKALQYFSDLKSKRGNAESDVLDGGQTPKSHIFWLTLNKEEDDDDVDDDGIPDKKLLRVNTETSQSTVVKDGSFSRGDLKSDDVFICDGGEIVFVWIGSNASPEEKKNGLPYAHNYLCGSGYPLRSITVVKEGQKCPQFEAALAA